MGLMQRQGSGTRDLRQQPGAVPPIKGAPHGLDETLQLVGKKSIS